jgi:hypothetical protein
VAVLVTVYGYMKYKGVKMLPKEIEDELEELAKTNAGLVSDFGELEKQVKTAVGNISLGDIQKIVTRAQELGKDGYTPEELQELGRLAVEATKN